MAPILKTQRVPFPSGPTISSPTTRPFFFLSFDDERPDARTRACSRGLSASAQLSIPKKNSVEIFRVGNFETRVSGLIRKGSTDERKGPTPRSSRKGLFKRPRESLRLEKVSYRTRAVSRPHTRIDAVRVLKRQTRKKVARETGVPQGYLERFAARGLQRYLHTHILERESTKIPKV